MLSSFSPSTPSRLAWPPVTQTTSNEAHRRWAKRSELPHNRGADTAVPPVLAEVQWLVAVVLAEGKSQIDEDV